MRTRARKPTAELERLGAPRARKRRKTEPVTTALTHAEPPQCYDPEQTKVWESFAPMLIANGTLTASDLPIFDAFIRTQAEYLKLDQKLTTEGTTYQSNGRQYPRPELAARNDARRELRNLAVQLGLTPASRSHVEKAKTPYVNKFAL